MTACANKIYEIAVREGRRCLEDRDPELDAQTEAESPDEVLPVAQLFTAERLGVQRTSFVVQITRLAE